MNWDPRNKPPADLCPKGFCFHWAHRGDRIDTRGRDYATFEEAVAAAQTVVLTAQCKCIFGTCSRAVSSPANRDHYEPNERALQAAGLPWFYFISGPENVGAESRDQYVSESAELWGTGTNNDSQRE